MWRYVQFINTIDRHNGTGQPQPVFAHSGKTDLLACMRYLELNRCVRPWRMIRYISAGRAMAPTRSDRPTLSSLRIPLKVTDDSG